MGRPLGDSSSYQTDQPQEYPLDATIESTAIQSDFAAQTLEINYYDSTQQDMYSADPEPQQQQEDYNQQPPQQQQYQPSQFQPPEAQQPQAQQYPPTPPQANQGYGPSPTPPSQFPPQSRPNNPAYPPQGPQTIPSRPPQFPAQSPIQPAAYPPQSPQTIPTQPVQFPPPSPQSHPIYPGGTNQTVAFPPQRPQQISRNYPPQVTLQPFPPQAALQAFTQNAYQASQPQAVSFPPQNNAAPGYNMPSSPYKPAAQATMAAPGIPVMTQEGQVYNEGWRTGLFDCMEDPMNAVTTACFPCITFGQVAEIIDNGHTSCGTSGLLYGLIAAFIGLPCIMSCSYRTKLRAKYGLVESPAPDWVTHFFCEWLAGKC
ncbi:hypothetical protein GH714_026868 [Hevea brasiliensis]|uniref:Uncharacterized protein n=1 Tax=Hevea brasiliensis TaxID=3981 RepID=A0A6A6LE66_HEVBR|nr:hypothetical protein GH714_026868 [Hevea brasiliensis]